MEQAVSVALKLGSQNIEEVREHLDELEFLAETMRISVKKHFTQGLQKPDTKFFIGKGKVQEIKDFAKSRNIETFIFDDDLTPSQLRNLERELKGKIYDRSLLILDIFLKRAQTAQAKVQVELARYEYLLPRLTRMWTHLERQRGGTSTRGGAGEKEIETDKRVIRGQIKLLKDRLAKIEKQGATQRKSRGNIVRVALVGYTNVGKSTLMNLLTNTKVLAEDKLFATVDSTVRKIVINDVPFLISDTVGFIRKLPHSLIESFKSTLDEVREADILIHLVDVSHPQYEDHMQTVEMTLDEIGATNKPTLVVFNKIDKVDKVDRSNLNANLFPGRQAILISATKKENIDRLKSTLHNEVVKRHMTIYPNYLKKEAF
ncbi:MAG: GTPase HflX [Cyclobacteriaceae bacterium]